MQDPIALTQLSGHPIPPGAGPGRDGDDPKEKCGVVGVWGERDGAPSGASLAYLGTYAQQHRGQEAAGIAVTDGEHVVAHTGPGLIADVFDTERLAALARSGGRGAIAHNRYTTSGGTKSCNFQPLVETYADGDVALAHNGNLINAEVLRNLFEDAGHLFHTTSDTEVIIHLLASPQQRKSEDPLAATLRRLQGAYSLVFLFPDRIEAARDPWGWRPLMLGRLEDGRHVVASETVAIDVMGGEVIREIEPGEIVTLSDAGVSSRRFADPVPRRAHCVFEHVYFASPASTVFGQNVQLVRERLGERLSTEAPVEADYVMPMPDSGRSAANGYARASGIPYREGIVPNRYVGRTFIKPSQDERRAAVRLKLNIISDIVRGARLIVVDDSIVRGTTTREKMRQLRAAGAAEIHLRISAPPIHHPCYFGVDFASRDQLIAHQMGDVEAIRGFLGVDSLHYLSLDGLLEVASRPPDPAVPGDDGVAPEHYCSACFSGEYRLDIDRPETGEIVMHDQLAIFPAG